MEAQWEGHFAIQQELLRAESWPEHNTCTLHYAIPFAQATNFVKAL